MIVNYKDDSKEHKTCSKYPLIRLHCQEQFTHGRTLPLESNNCVTLLWCIHYDQNKQCFEFLVPCIIDLSSAPMFLLLYFILTNCIYNAIINYRDACHLTERHRQYVLISLIYGASHAFNPLDIRPHGGRGGGVVLTRHNC